METKEIFEDKELKDLRMFYGTSKYIGIMGVKITDGIEYIMKNGYSWFITDSIVIINTLKATNEFLSVKLVTDLKEHKAKMVITDGNEKVLHTQKYGYTDSKVSEISLYFTDNVYMYSGEY